MPQYCFRQSSDTGCENFDEDDTLVSDEDDTLVSDEDDTLVSDEDDTLVSDEPINDITDINDGTKSINESSEQESTGRNCMVRL